MRLNLGCGNDVKEGYVNVDFRQTHSSVVLMDLSKLPWSFEDGSAEEVLMLDFLEHFPYVQTPGILLECFRVLAPGGKVVIQVPDAAQTMRALVQKGDYLCNRCGAKMLDVNSPVMHGSQLRECPGCHQSADDISEAAMRRFYGGQDYVGNFHQTCFTRQSLDLKASAAGLRPANATVDEDHYYRNWTLIRIYEKGELW